MYAPHTVTLYNVLQETDLETFEDVERVYITILRGVFLDAVKAVNVRVSGQESADAVSLFIPFGVTAVDCETGMLKAYKPPQEFWAMPHEDRASFWTLGFEGNGGETFFVKGDPVELFAPADYDGIMSSDGWLLGAMLSRDCLNVNMARAQDESYTVTKVDTKDFGSPQMRHWEVGGA